MPLTKVMRRVTLKLSESWLMFQEAVSAAEQPARVRAAVAMTAAARWRSFMGSPRVERDLGRLGWWLAPAQQSGPATRSLEGGLAGGGAPGPPRVLRRGGDVPRTERRRLSGLAVLGGLRVQPPGVHVQVQGRGRLAVIPRPGAHARPAGEGEELAFLDVLAEGLRLVSPHAGSHPHGVGGVDPLACLLVVSAGRVWDADVCDGFPGLGESHFGVGGRVPGDRHFKLGPCSHFFSFLGCCSYSDVFAWVARIGTRRGEIFRDQIRVEINQPNRNDLVVASHEHLPRGHFAPFGSIRSHV
nr:MAG TPA: hypothetical protein [Caudoviricetes sp.]